MRALSRLFRSLPMAPTLERGERLLAGGDPAGAFAQFSRAAKSGDSEAQFRVGRCYMEATGVPPSLVEAAVWFERAASAGHAESQARLAAMFMQGLLRKNPGSRSSALFEPGNSSGPDYASAADWARKASAGGSAEGKALLATLLTSGPEEMRDPETAETLYRESSSTGNGQGKLGLALMLVRGEPDEPARQEAAVLMAEAAATGLPMARYLLGVMNDFAIGVERDQTKAIQLYRQAAEAGIRPGQRGMAWP